MIKFSSKKAPFFHVKIVAYDPFASRNQSIWKFCIMDISTLDPRSRISIRSNRLPFILCRARSHYWLQQYSRILFGHWYIHAAAVTNDFRKQAIWQWDFYFEWANLDANCLYPVSTIVPLYDRIPKPPYITREWKNSKGTPCLGKCSHLMTSRLTSLSRRLRRPLFTALSANRWSRFGRRWTFTVHFLGV